MSNEITLATFDLETSGVDVENDRIVSAYLAYLDEKGAVTAEYEWLIDPGIEIPAEATAVHGITTDRARSEGMAPADALIQIGAHLAHAANQGTPIVIYNAPFDLTLLDRELRRNGLDDGIWFPLTRIIDPLVLDKAIDKYRKGSRRLADVARHWNGPGFVESEWHGAKADALAAGKLARLLLADYRLAEAEPESIHAWQVTWYRRQAESFAAYLHGKGEDTTGIRTDWPMIPWDA